MGVSQFNKLPINVVVILARPASVWQETVSHKQDLRSSSWQVSGVGHEVLFVRPTGCGRFRVVESSSISVDAKFQLAPRPRRTTFTVSNKIAKSTITERFFR